MGEKKKQRKDSALRKKLDASLKEYIDSLWIESSESFEARQRILPGEDTDPNLSAEEFYGRSSDYGVYARRPRDVVENHSAASTELWRVLSELKPKAFGLPWTANSFLDAYVDSPLTQLAHPRGDELVRDLLSEAEIENVIGNFRAELEALPRVYEVTIKVIRCHSPELVIDPIPLGDGLYLQKPTAGTLRNVTDEEGWLFITGSLEGYLQPSGPVVDRSAGAISRLMQVRGLLKALGLTTLAPFRQYEATAQPEISRPIRILGDRLDLRPGLIGYAAIEYNSWVTKRRLSEPENEFERGLSPESIAAKRLKTLAGIFESASDGRRILLAAEWSYKASSSTLDLPEQIIFLITGYEALLGEPDEREGVTDRLADRLAFLIAASHSERLTLKKFFKKLYGDRSDLLHQGHLDLTEKLQVNLMNGAAYLNQAIAKELDLWSKSQQG